jgi:hypothetical protein
MEPYRFLCLIGSSSCDVLLSLLRDQVSNLTSKKRSRGFHGLSFESLNKVANGLIDAIFGQPSRRVASSSVSRRQDVNILDEDGFDVGPDESNGGFAYGAHADPSVVLWSTIIDETEVTAMPPAHLILFEAFKMAASNGCCVKWRETLDHASGASLRAVIFLPALDEKSVRVTKQPPVRVEVTVSTHGGIRIRCVCQHWRLAKNTLCTSTEVLGAEGGMCWHERFCQEPGSLSRLMHQLPPLKGAYL